MSITKATSTARRYTVVLDWDGNLGEGTATYTSYSRAYRISVTGKPALAGSADPAYRGEADRHNPEDLFLAAVTACHMLSYLSLCARQGVRVLSYEDHVSGTLRVRADGGGGFEEVTLRPVVTIAEGCDEALAEQLHNAAHERCFIANSCRIPIRCEVTVSKAQFRASASVSAGPSDLPVEPTVAS